MLRCLRPFNEAGIVAREGDTFSGPPDVEAWLVDSWPSAWERFERPAEAPAPAQEVKALDAAPADKMMRKAKGRK